MLRLRNFTPHTVNLYDGKFIAAWPSEGEIRLEAEERLTDQLDIAIPGNAASDGKAKVVNVDFYNIGFTKITGMPEDIKQDELLIVSGYVADNAPRDMKSRFVVPHDLIRDDKGRVIGCRRFRYAR